MSIFQRDGVWWLDITMHGKRSRESCNTVDEKQAREYHDNRKAELWREAKLGERPRKTVEEAFARWLSEHQHKRSASDDLRHYEFWTQEFARCKVKYLDQVHPDVVAEIRNLEAKRVIVTAKGVEKPIAPATVNRKLSFLRTVMNAACREYRWVEVAPLIRLFPENNERVRWLTPTELGRLLNALPEPYSSMAEFAVATGLRQANVMGLRWEGVDFINRTATFPEKVMKNGQPFTIPLNQTAMAVVRRWIGKHEEFVFVRTDGQQVRGLPTNTWTLALKKAGLQNFKWHDLRHTWASLLRQSGKVGLDLLQELGGWKSAKMVQRYAHLSVEHLASSADVLDAVLSPSSGREKVFAIR